MVGEQRGWGGTDSNNNNSGYHQVLLNTRHYQRILQLLFYLLSTMIVNIDVNLAGFRITWESYLWAHLWGSFCVGFTEVGSLILNRGSVIPWTVLSENKRRKGTDTSIYSPSASCLWANCDQLSSCCCRHNLPAMWPGPWNCEANKPFLSCLVRYFFPRKWEK